MVVRLPKMTNFKDGQKPPPHHEVMENERDIVLDDRRIKVDQVAEAMNILEDRVRKI